MEANDLIEGKKNDNQISFSLHLINIFFALEAALVVIILNELMQFL